MRYTNNRHFANSDSVDQYRGKQNQYTHLWLSVLSINLSLDHSTIDLASAEHEGIDQITPYKAVRWSW